jgi:uncharacterized protein (DUF58 family)
MIAPTSRLLWAAGLAITPALAIAGLLASAAAACFAVIALFVALAAIDAWRGNRNAQLVTATVPENSLRWFQNREAKLVFDFGGVAQSIEAAADLPAEIRGQQPVSVNQNGRAEILCTPAARGRYQLNQCFVRVSSPAKLWKANAAKRIALSIQVFPDLDHEPGARLLFRQRQLGVRRQRPVGRGREFERLREYVPGDSFEEIYWKATARRGSPVVKVFQIERTQDVYAIIDAGLRSRLRDRMDRFIRASLMLALAAENEGDNFGLVTFDRQVTRFVPAARGRRHFAHCRDALYDLQAAPSAAAFDELFTFLQLRVRRRALLLFLTDLEDPIAAEAFFTASRLLTSKHVLLVGTMQDPHARRLFSGDIPTTVDSIHDRLAGHLQWASLKETEKKLQKIGIGMRSLRPQSMGLDLIEEYLDVKQRQIL